MNRTVIFDAVRKLLARGLRQHEVDALDAAIDMAIDEEPGHRTIGQAGIDLIRRFEGCARLRADGLFEAYPDPATGGAPWTIGWGATGPGIAQGTVWTQAQCDERLDKDLVRYADEVSKAIGGSATTPNQFDAMVSFHYNTGAIGRATLTEKHIAGDHSGAAREFPRWNRAGGKILSGLTRRRAAEAALYQA